MIEGPALTVFLIATMALLITPGPAVLYIVARSIDQGRTAGIVSVLGIGMGTLFHVVAAALGLSALLATSALAFNAVKYLGAAYLIYLGMQKLLAREASQMLGTPEPQKLSRIFSGGIIVNVLNPKAALFFLAFLPQFVDPSRGSAVTQILVLGLIFLAMAIVSDSLYALLAGSIGQWLRGSMRVVRGQRYVAGAVYITLGVSTAASSAVPNT